MYSSMRGKRIYYFFNGKKNSKLFNRKVSTINLTGQKATCLKYVRLLQETSTEYNLIYEIKTLNCPRSRKTDIKTYCLNK